MPEYRNRQLESQFLQLCNGKQLAAGGAGHIRDSDLNPGDLLLGKPRDGIGLRHKPAAAALLNYRGRIGSAADERN
ncbi:MAG: hypothetical protein WD078_01955 [Woeseia sp.]